MALFEKWAWIKRNWIYILEEASPLNLVFVGGTALNLAKLPFPQRECDVLENRFNERLLDIKTTRKEDLLAFQTMKQIDDLPYEAFEKFKGWIHDWLSRFR